jgi:hypothetical protein
MHPALELRAIVKRFDGATALDAVRALDAEEAGAVERGARALADSRGLPADPAARTYAGAIYRVIAPRRRGSDAPPA